MIKKIKHNNIDFTKYDGCITAAFNHRVYAESWYLNLMTNNSWDCLVLNDYEAVMPLPFKKKMGIKYIVMPNFCQQLGVFYAKEITTEQFTLFEKKLHRYLVRSYHFNEENTTVFQPKGELRNNYVLPLENDIENSFELFHKNRKYDLKKLDNFKYQIVQKSNIVAIKVMVDEHYLNIINKQQFELIEKLILESENTPQIIQSNLVMEGKMLAVNIFLKSSGRVINLCSFRDKKFKQFNTTAALLFDMMQQSPNTIFDFEGSMIKGVAAFFESFGATKDFYTVYKNC